MLDCGVLPTSNRIVKRSRPKAFEPLQDVRCPAEHVSSGDHTAKCAHPRAPLLARHVDGADERGRKSVHVVRIDDEGVLQLLRRTRQLAQHQHAVLVVARGDEFLGDQVHPVVQRADDAEVRETVERHQRLDPQRRGLIRDERCTVGCTVAPVELPDPRRDLRLDFAVAMEVRS